jgi:transposase
MPKFLFARPPKDAEEERQVRKLAGSLHAPADWVFHAKMIVLSWAELRTTTIAAEIHCHPQTVRERILAFNERGLDGLGMRPGSGRRPRLTQTERSAILALAQQAPPGRLRPAPDSGELYQLNPDDADEWTLDTLTQAAQEQGITVHRSQVRRIFLTEGIRWRNTRQWASSHDKAFIPKERRSSRSTPTRPPTRRSSVSMN